MIFSYSMDGKFKYAKDSLGPAEKLIHTFRSLAYKTGIVTGPCNYWSKSSNFRERMHSMSYGMHALIDEGLQY